MFAKATSGALALLALAQAASACMLASFTYDPCTSSISGTIIDNGATIGQLSGGVGGTTGSPIPLSQAYSSRGIYAFVHTVTSSDNGKKAGWLSHVSFHDSTGAVTQSFELIRDKEQKYSNAVYGCDDTAGDAWFYAPPNNGWERWGISHPTAKGWEGRLRCDSEGLVWQDRPVETGIALAGRRATGAARRAAATEVMDAQATAGIETVETPRVMVEEPVATAFARREVGQAATEELAKQLAGLRSWKLSAGGGGALSALRPGEVDEHAAGSVRSDGFRMRHAQPGGGLGEAQIGESAETGLGAGWRRLREGEAWKALAAKVAQAAEEQATQVVKREEPFVEVDVGDVGNKNDFRKAERRAAQTTSW